jgi:hypothetical protein
MLGHGQAMGLGQVEHAQYIGHTGHAGYVGLLPANGLLGMALGIVVPKRTFKPEHIERLGATAKAQAGRQIPLDIAIDGQRDVRADCAVHGLQAAQVALHGDPTLILIPVKPSSTACSG